MNPHMTLVDAGHGRQQPASKTSSGTPAIAAQEFEELKQHDKLTGCWANFYIWPRAAKHPAISLKTRVPLTPSSTMFMCSKGFLSRQNSMLSQQA